MNETNFNTVDEFIEACYDAEVQAIYNSLDSAVSVALHQSHYPWAVVEALMQHTEELTQVIKEAWEDHIERGYN